MPDVFYILNYDNILRSYGMDDIVSDSILFFNFLSSPPPPIPVTLFALMVVNNWFVIIVSSIVDDTMVVVINLLLCLQEGFASQEGRFDWLVRIYFMCFNIITLVVLQVVISFIVEAFVFKIQAREKSRKCVQHNKPSSSCGCDEGNFTPVFLDLMLVDEHHLLVYMYQIFSLQESCRKP